MWLRRQALLWAFALASILCFACGSSATSTLVTVRTAKGSGPIDFSIENTTDATINNAYMAKSDSVRDAGHESNEPGSTAEAEVWGDDLLSGAIGVGKRVGVRLAGPGTWDVRVVDQLGRYQHISGLKLGAGGRYILKIGEGSWRVY